MKILPYILLLALPFLIHSQNQQNIWMMSGEIGINYNSGIPSSFTKEVYSLGSKIITLCDPVSGSLLFYTDGMRAWNADMEVMQNGQTLGGWDIKNVGISIINNADSPNEFLLFYVNDITNELLHSKVDLSLDSGKGGIVSGMKSIKKDEGLIPMVLDIPGECGSNINWLITHYRNSNEFVIYKIVGDAIVSFQTQAIGQDYGKIMNAYVSPNFNQVVFSNPYGEEELFYFDRANGNLTYRTSFDLDGFFEIAFSKNSRYMYLANQEEVFQLDISLIDEEAILSSLSTVYKNETPTAGIIDIERTPHNSIIIKLPIESSGSTWSYPAITNANKKWPECTVDEDYFTFPKDLIGATKFPILPTIPPYHESFDFLPDQASSCNGFPLSLPLPEKEYGYYILGDSVIEELIIDEPGMYKVLFQNECPFYDSVYIGAITAESLIEDTTICNGEVFMISPSEFTVDNFTWEDGSSE